jgi:flavin-dependent dehydrogenase
LHEVGFERLLVIGDAAGFVEPFTGEGIAWALTAARAVTPVAHAAARSWDPSFARQWTGRYRRTVIARQLACRALTSLLRSDNFTGVLVRALRIQPSLASLFVRRFAHAI